MGAITIRNLDDDTISAIKRQAAEKGVSMEEEVRRLLSGMYGSEARRQRVKEWAEKQLERLHRGELPRLGIDSAELIRSMREERDQQLMEAIEGRSEPDR